MDHLQRQANSRLLRVWRKTHRPQGRAILGTLLGSCKVKI